MNTRQSRFEPLSATLGPINACPVVGNGIRLAAETSAEATDTVDQLDTEGPHRIFAGQP